MPLVAEETLDILVQLILSSSNLIILTGYIILFFLIERFFDFYWKRRELGIEQKKPWSQHVMANIMGLHVLEYDLTRLAAVMKYARSKNDFMTLFELLDHPQHLNIQEQQPLETLNSGYVVVFDEIVRPRLRDHVLALTLQHPVSSSWTTMGEGDPFLQWFARYLELLIAHVNLVRLKITHGFSDRKSFGHVMIRSPLMKVISDLPQATKKKLANPDRAKKFVSKERHYQLVSDKIHLRYKKLMDEWKVLMNLLDEKDAK